MSRSTGQTRLIVVAAVLLFLVALPAAASAAGKPIVSADRRGTDLISHDTCQECDFENPDRIVGEAQFQAATRRARSVRVAVWNGRQWSASVGLKRKGRPQNLPCGGGKIRSFRFEGCKFTHWYASTSDEQILRAILQWKSRTEGFTPPLLFKACGRSGCTHRRTEGTY